MSVIVKAETKIGQNFWQRFKQNKMAIAATIILIILILSIIILPFFYRIPMNKIDFTQASLPPSWEHPFGTNTLGQDQLARILFGGRITLNVGLSAMLVSIIFGTTIGAIAGFYGGIIDNILMRLTDLFLSLPQLPVLLLVIYLFRDIIKSIAGPELGIFFLLVIVIGLLNWMSVARLVRGSFLQLKEMEFISAAKSLGASPIRLILIHILPNIFSVIIVAATLGIGNAIIVESTLSFLGLGFPPDFPTWGRMLYDAKDYLDLKPYLAIFPGLVIFLTVLSINYIGDGLRDALNPK